MSRLTAVENLSDDASIDAGGDSSEGRWRRILVWVRSDVERIRVSYHQGRLLDHVHLRVSDVGASKRFYRAVLGALSLLGGYGEGEGYFYADELYVDRAETDKSRVHLAFQAKSEQEVRAFHAAAIAAGGEDNGAPGPRSYHGKYYAAFALDPDGNNIEAVWHGPTNRSAESVFIERQ